MHLKKIADFAAQKIVFCFILLSIILFISPKRRPSSLWGNDWRWRDKRLGCLCLLVCYCHWEIIDPRTLPICTKNALNNRIKKVPSSQPKALGQNWPSIFAQRDEKWAFFSSVDGDAHQQRSKKEKKFQFSERFPMQVFSSREKKSESCSWAPCQNGTRHNPILWHFFAAQKLHRNSASAQQH